MLCTLRVNIKGVIFTVLFRWKNRKINHAFVVRGTLEVFFSRLKHR